MHKVIVFKNGWVSCDYSFFIPVPKAQTYFFAKLSFILCVKWTSFCFATSNLSSHPSSKLAPVCLVITSQFKLYWHFTLPKLLYRGVLLLALMHRFAQVWLCQVKRVFTIVAMVKVCLAVVPKAVTVQVVVFEVELACSLVEDFWHIWHPESSN